MALSPGPVGFLPTQIHPWDYLMRRLCEELNDEEKEYLMQFYIRDGEVPGSFETLVAERIGKDIDSAEQLKRYLKGQYGGQGSFSWSEKIEGYIRDLQEYIHHYEIKPTTTFIGRDADVNKVCRDLEDYRNLGLIVHGFGGQGKSCLANQVCHKFQEKGWLVLKIDLRNVTHTSDVLKTLLLKLKQPFPTCEHVDLLMKILVKGLHAIKHKTLFCLDDCDKIFQNQYEHELFQDAFYSLFHAQVDAQVRILITTREKVPEKPGEDKLFAQHHLMPLVLEDGVDLLKCCSGMTFEVDKAEEIVHKCACSPMAIKMVSTMLKEGKFTTDHLIFHLNMDKNVSKGLGVRSIIEETITNLDPLERNALAAMSVFQASPFEFGAVEKILQNICHNTGTCMSVLQRLHDSNLLEVESRHKSERKCTYSLHPLVYQYLSEQIKSEAYTIAVQNFVEYYEKLIGRIMRGMNTRYWKGRWLLETNKIHIMKFYSIMADEPELLRPMKSKFSPIELLIKKHLSDLSDLMISNVMKRRIFTSETKRAQKAKNDDAFIFWMVEEADVFNLLHDQPDIALQMLEKLSEGRYAALRGLHADPFYNKLVHSLFHKVKGLAKWKKLQYQSAMEHLNLSVCFLQKIEPLPQDFICKVWCFIGEMHIEIGDFQTAYDVLQTSFEALTDILHNNAKPSKQSEQSYELHLAIPKHYYLFALIEFKKALLEPDPKEKTSLFSNAKQKLGKGMKLDEALKIDYLDCYYTKMKLLADIYVEEGQIDKAYQDALFVLDQRREILQPPHKNYTESVYQVARICMLQGKKCALEGKQDEAKDQYKTSVCRFSEMIDHHLKQGHIPREHELYKNIRRDHIRAAECLGDQKETRKVLKFYK
ncbi:hypothetical protein DPMN_170248, partial [Dreissena polymorpha]